MCSSFMSLSDQVSLIEKLRIFKIQGRDKRGRKILRVVGKFFPVRFVSADALIKYTQKKIFPKLEKQPFSVLYIHTGVERTENCLSLAALRSIYDAVPVAVKNNLEAIYFVHPGLQSRLFLATFGRLLFSGGLYGKVKYMSRVEYLWDEVRRKEMDVPDFVYEHDEELDYRPMMMDYGMESDHPRVYGALSLDSPVAAYSMRCIS